ncbi:hypothetical protein CH340_08315 [Rhodoplanes serenus]|nr:hypothetical protein CH340_08315 [Rhodoplanes serenus]
MSTVGPLGAAGLPGAALGAAGLPVSPGLARVGTTWSTSSGPGRSAAATVAVAAPRLIASAASPTSSHRAGRTLLRADGGRHEESDDIGGPAVRSVVRIARADRLFSPAASRRSLWLAAVRVQIRV